MTRAHLRTSLTPSEYVTPHRFDAVLSGLPYFHNPAVAELARAHRPYYFDLTEDVAVTGRVKVVSEGPSEHSFLMRSAPGFISIVTNDLIGQFDSIDHVKMRVGALPVHPE